MSNSLTRRFRSRLPAAHQVHLYELVGQTREEGDRRQGERDAGRKIEKAGIYQATQWILGQFPNPGPPKAWLKQRRPEVYKVIEKANNGTSEHYFPGASGSITVSEPASQSTDAYPGGWENAWGSPAAGCTRRRLSTS